MPELPPLEPLVMEMLFDNYESLTAAQKTQLNTQRTYWQNQGYEVRIGPRQHPH